LRAGKERGEGEESADSPGPAVRERGEREVALGLREEVGRGSAHAGERKEGGSAGPRVAHAGERRGKRGPKGKKEGVWAAGLLLLSPLILLFFFFPTLKLFKQTYLNSNKFEFKPYKLHTRKIMLQHECTNMLTL
jgi:hypothetical protein